MRVIMDTRCLMLLLDAKGLLSLCRCPKKRRRRKREVQETRKIDVVGAAR